MKLAKKDVLGWLKTSSAMVGLVMFSMTMAISLPLAETQLPIEEAPTVAEEALPPNAAATPSSYLGDRAPVKITDQTTQAPSPSLADAQAHPIAIFTATEYEQGMADGYAANIDHEHVSENALKPLHVAFVQDDSPAQEPVVQSSTSLAGDVEAGERSFAVCRSCHSLDEGRNGVGPSLYGLIGRKAGSVEGFKYSQALIDSEVIWTPEALDMWLKNSAEFIPGNKMAIFFRQGVPQDDKRADIIAYLASQ